MQTVLSLLISHPRAYDGGGGPSAPQLSVLAPTQILRLAELLRNWPRGEIVTHKPGSAGQQFYVTALTIRNIHLFCVVDTVISFSVTVSIFFWTHNGLFFFLVFIWTFDHTLAKFLNSNKVIK